MAGALRNQLHSPGGFSCFQRHDRLQHEISIYGHSYPAINVLSLDLFLFACVNRKCQRNYPSTSFMEGGERLLKAKQSVMTFAGFFLAKDSLHLKLPRKQTCRDNHPATILLPCAYCAQFLL